jgi:hypothetical protein
VFTFLVNGMNSLYLKIMNRSNVTFASKNSFSRGDFFRHYDRNDSYCKKFESERISQKESNFQVKRDKSRKGHLSYIVDYRKTRVR